MKGLKILLSFITSVTLISACRDDKLSPVPFDEVTTSYGAYVQELEVSSDSYDLFNLDNATFKTKLQIYDTQNGANFAGLDIYASFTDNSPDNDTVDVSEVKLLSFDASKFSADSKNGRPTMDLTIPATQAMAALGITADQLAGGDSFNFRQVLNLKDGRAYTTTNTGLDVLAGPFYSSPFVNSVNIVCNFPDSFAGKYVGNYMYEALNDGPNGPIFGDPHVIKLENVKDKDGVTITTKRKFSAVYLAGLDIGNSADVLTFDFVCDKVVFGDNQKVGLGCTSSIFIGTATSSGTYDQSDDSVLDIWLTDEKVDGGCGDLPTQTHLRFTKQ